MGHAHREPLAERVGIVAASANAADADQECGNRRSGQAVINSGAGDDDAEEDGLQRCVQLFRLASHGLAAVDRRTYPSVGA